MLGNDPTRIDPGLIVILDWIVQDRSVICGFLPSLCPELDINLPCKATYLVESTCCIHDSATTPFNFVKPVFDASMSCYSYKFDLSRVRFLMQIDCLASLQGKKIRDGFGWEGFGKKRGKLPTQTQDKHSLFEITLNWDFCFQIAFALFTKAQSLCLTPRKCNDGDAGNENANS